MIQLPECPQNIDELEMLMFALLNPQIDKGPKEYAKWLDGEVKKMRRNGQPQIAELLRIYSDSQDQIQEAFSYMLRWGANRREAAKNYIAHIERPCNWCIDIYSDILIRDAEADLRRDKKRDLSVSIEKALLDNALDVHLEYLGSPELEKLTGIKFRDRLINLN